jgi:hypothetical protein
MHADVEQPVSLPGQVVRTNGRGISGSVLARGSLRDVCITLVIDVVTARVSGL